MNRWIDSYSRTRVAQVQPPAKRRLVPLFLLFLISVAPMMVRAQQQQPAPQPVVEISVKLKGIDGKIYDVTEMRGQVLLVSFGATWCSPCWTELQALEELKREYKDQPVQFLWVSIEGTDEISDGKLRSFAKARGISFPVLRDPWGVAYAQFSTRRRIPLVVFFNQEGKLVAPQHAGMAEPELYKRTMRERLDRLLLPAQTQKVSIGNK